MQQKLVISVLTVLFLLSMAQTGLDWYGIDWAFVTRGATRDTIFDATSGHPPALVHLFQKIAFFGSFILADWLMVR